MLSSEYFYHGTTKRIIALFGSIFSGIEIVKTPDDPNESGEKIIVPIQFGPTQKYFLKNEWADEENYIRKYSLPRIVYNLESISYESAKKSAAQQRVYNKNIIQDGNSYLTQYVPTPYSLSFSTTIYSKYKNDIFQIVEQILPFFNPTLFFNINLIDEMDEEKDIAITLNSVNMESTFDEGFDSVTLHTSSLDFTVHSYYYGPIFPEKFIEKIRHNYYINKQDVDRHILTIYDL